MCDTNNNTSVKSLIQTLRCNCDSASSPLRHDNVTMTSRDDADDADRDVDSLPIQMTFNDESVMVIVAYSILCFIATVGNVTVFWTLCRYRCRSRVTLFLMHLSLADLIIAVVYMPLEIFWKVTVAWLAGDFACRVLMFFRAFGFYLSSFILVAISLDRYFAVARPLSLRIADRRGNAMLIAAWVLSVVASAPQSVIFHVEQHPNFTWFHQCVTFNFFPSPGHELAYNLFNFAAVYLVPLVVIVVSYSLILRVISKKAKENRITEHSLVTRTKRLLRRGEAMNFGLRATNTGIIQQARTRTLKMTIVIVSVFIVCWTPYFVISIWYWFDYDSASRINVKIQLGLFLFAVSNSCVDPIVYGMFSTVFRRSMNKRLQRIRSFFDPATRVRGLLWSRPGAEGGRGYSMTAGPRPGFVVTPDARQRPATMKNHMEAN